ncbi:MAG: hypothetical protein ABSB54_04790 [Acidimicrobiales bacterium]
MLESQLAPVRPTDRLRWWPFTALLALLLATVLGVGLGLAQAPRPVTFASDGITGLPVLNGQVGDFGVILGTTSDETITLQHVSLISVPGYPLPTLVHAVVVAPPSLGSDRGWPPLELAGDRLLSIGGLRVALTTSPRSVSELVYGVTASGSATMYAWAGMNVTYVLDGQQFSSPAYAGGALCVARNILHNSCNFDAATAAISAVVPA